MEKHDFSAKGLKACPVTDTRTVLTYRIWLAASRKIILAPKEPCFRRAKSIISVKNEVGMDIELLAGYFRIPDVRTFLQTYCR